MSGKGAADIHDAAARGFQSAARTYVAGRPDYPAAIVGWLINMLGIGPDSRVLDLGAGTGKFLASLKATGATLVAVEPVEAMRAQLAAANPDVDVRAGTAEAIPLPDASIDGVICAQAFHWFANERALAEIHRVLKPGGVLGLVWNVRDESAPWVAALTGIYSPYEGDAPRYHRGEWRALFPARGFGPLRESRFPHSHVGSPGQVILDRTMSISFIAALPDEERAMVADQVRQLIDGTPGIAGRASIAFPYETMAFDCRRID